MNRRERVLRAINRKDPDRVPWGELHLPKGLIERATGGADGFREELLAKRRFLDRFNLDLLVIEPSSERRRVVEEVGFWHEETDVFVFLLLTGGFTRVLNQVGWKEFFLTLAARPDQAAEQIKGANRELLEEAGPLLLPGVHGVIVGDDLAGRHGPLVDPAFLQAAVFPSLKELVGGIRSHVERPVFFHSDGKLDGIIDQVVEAGFQGLQGMEPTAGMDLGEVKRRCGDSLCLMGNLDLGCLLEGRDRELEDQVSLIMRSASPGGGFIFGTCGGLVEEIMTEQLEKLSHLVSKYGKYD